MKPTKPPVTTNRRTRRSEASDSTGYACAMNPNTAMAPASKPKLAAKLLAIEAVRCTRPNLGHRKAQSTRRARQLR